MYEDVKISVVIVNYNVKYFVEQCLYSVQAAMSGLSGEVFVVDNNSTDDSMAYLKPRFPQVTFIENRDNPGFAKANNQAIRICRGKYVLLLNPDTVIGEDSLRSLCLFMDEHPEAGGIGVKMIDGHGLFLPESKRSFPSPWVSFCKLFGLSSLFPNSPRFSRYALRYLDENKLHKVDVLAGAFMLMRHEALDRVGLLDESFFMYGEDIDLSYRLVLGGYQNYYIPERMLHYKGESTKHGDMKYIKAFYGAMIIFFRKYYPHSGWLMEGLIRTAVFLKALLASLLAPFRVKHKPKVKHRHLLVVCRQVHLNEVKAACMQQMPDCESVSWWNIDSCQAVDLIGSRQSEGITDYAVCYPDVRFEQLFLLMDKMPNKRSVYHIYTMQSGRLVSPGK